MHPEARPANYAVLSPVAWHATPGCAAVCYVFSMPLHSRRSFRPVYLADSYSKTPARGASANSLMTITNHER